MNFMTARIQRLQTRMRTHRVAVLVVVLGASTLCFAVVPAEAAYGLVQAIALALIAFAGVILTGQQPVNARTDAYHISFWIMYILVIAFVAGMSCFWAEPQSVVQSTINVKAPHDTQSIAWFGYVLAFVLSCFFTAIFEESLFRVLVFDAFLWEWRSRRYGVLLAAMVSSVLFGLMHVSVGGLSADQPFVVLQAIAKPLQAALFGLVMAALYVSTRSLWFVVGLHSFFDMLYLGPLVVTTGMPTTYVTGNSGEAGVLCATVLLLIPLAYVAVKQLSSARVVTQDAAAMK